MTIGQRGLLNTATMTMRYVIVCHYFWKPENAKLQDRITSKNKDYLITVLLRGPCVSIVYTNTP